MGTSRALRFPRTWSQRRPRHSKNRRGWCRAQPRPSPAPPRAVGTVSATSRRSSADCCTTSAHQVKRTSPLFRGRDIERHVVGQHPADASNSVGQLRRRVAAAARQQHDARLPFGPLRRRVLIAVQHGGLRVDLGQARFGRGQVGIDLAKPSSIARKRASQSAVRRRLAVAAKLLRTALPNFSIIAHSACNAAIVRQASARSSFNTASFAVKASAVCLG